MSPLERWFRASQIIIITTFVVVPSVGIRGSADFDKQVFPERTFAVRMCYKNALDRVLRKRVFWHMRTAKAQTSLRIHAVWSRPSLSADKIIAYYRIYEWRAKARMIVCAYGDRSESVHFAHVRRFFFA